MLSTVKWGAGLQPWALQHGEMQEGGTEPGSTLGRSMKPLLTFCLGFCGSPWLCVHKNLMGVLFAVPGEYDTILGPLKSHSLAKILGIIAPTCYPSRCKAALLAAGPWAVRGHRLGGVHRYQPLPKAGLGCRAAVPAHAGEAIHLFTANVSIETPPELRMWILELWWSELSAPSTPRAALAVFTAELFHRK